MWIGRTPRYEIVSQTVLKKYCSLIHGQPVLEAVLDLKRSNGLVAAKVERVRCDVFQGAYDFAGGGRYGSKDHPQAKEQADYNLKYLIAAALLDDQVGPAQLQPARIQAPDAQALLARVQVRPDERFTARYPKELNARITIFTKDQRIFVKEQLGYEGGLTNPMSWDRIVEKFHWLSEPFANKDLRSRLIETVQQLDSRRIADLTELLAQVRPTAVSPRSLPALAAAEIASWVAWLKPFAITGTVAENLHWISYAMASPSMKSSPDAPDCSAAARTVPKLSLG